MIFLIMEMKMFTMLDKANPDIENIRGFNQTAVRLAAIKMTNFIIVGCILLRYVYVYLSNIPAIATENLFVLLFSLCSQLFRPLRAIFRRNTITSPEGRGRNML
jgi:hypothetical protein